MIDQEPLEALLATLYDPDEPIRAVLVYRLSDITAADLSTLSREWATIPVERRRALLRRLLDATETTFDVDYATVARLALQDEDEEVRRHAISALWTDDTLNCMELIVERLKEDPSAVVRANAAAELGRFVLMAELEEIDVEAVKAAEEALLDAHNNEDDLDVRRRALEGIAFSSREEVPRLISRAASDKNKKMRASAIFAMGRSADERWEDSVLEALTDEDPEMRYEAARAAGELQSQAAVPTLIRFLRDDDAEIKGAAIWSLGEIGGSDAVDALSELLDEEEDSPLGDDIEDALNMAMLMSGQLGLITRGGGMGLDDEDLIDDYDDFDPDDLR